MLRKFMMKRKANKVRRQIKGVVKRAYNDVSKSMSRVRLPVRLSFR